MWLQLQLQATCRGATPIARFERCLCNDGVQDIGFGAAPAGTAAVGTPQQALAPSSTTGRHAAPCWPWCGCMQHTCHRVSQCYGRQLYVKKQNAVAPCWSACTPPPSPTCLVCCSSDNRCDRMSSTRACWASLRALISANSAWICCKGAWDPACVHVQRHEQLFNLLSSYMHIGASRQPRKVVALQQLNSHLLATKGAGMCF